VFRGQHEHAIDAKGRTSFPARFRTLLETRGDLRIVLMPWTTECLAVYPWAEWEAFEAKVAALPQLDQDVEDFQRKYMSGAHDIELDKLGRILVPPRLRAHAHLEREVLWAGMTTRIELWDLARFNGVTSPASESPAKVVEMKKKLAGLGL
jgi:MraZ protein